MDMEIGEGWQSHMMLVLKKTERKLGFFVFG